MASFNWPANGAGGGIAIYPNVAAFPLSGNITGQQAIDASNVGNIYEWNGTSWILTATSSSVNAITALTGDGTATGPGSVPLTLATVNLDTGSFGTATDVSSITVNGKGLITAVSNIPIQIAESQVTNLVSDLAAKAPINSPTFTGTVTIPTPFVLGAVSVTTTGTQLNYLNAATGITGTNSLVFSDSPTLVTPALGTPSSVTLTNATGLPLISGVTGILPIANGGTGQNTAAQAFIALSPLTTAGDLIYENSSPAPTRLSVGGAGNVLTVVGGLPAWAPPATSGTVTSVSVVSANGFAGTVATPTSTPALTLSTTITAPALAANGTAISAATTTGTGSTVVLNSAPTLITPDIGAATGTSLNLSALSASQAVVSDGSKNLVSLPYATAPAASTLAEWDANKNLSSNSFIPAFRTQATANSTLTLVVGDAQDQYFTGTTAGQVVQLPTTSIVAGQYYSIVNLSTQSIAVNSSGGNLIATVLTNTAVTVTAVVATPTTAANWSTLSGGSGSTSPLTTKGDLYGFSTVNARIPVGTNAFALLADSAQTLGLKWAQVDLTAGVTGILPIANGGTNVNAVTIAPAATAFAGWDANKNLSANNHIAGWQTIATAAGTTTLVVGSPYETTFTGTSTQICALPTTAIVAGQAFKIVNSSTGIVTVNSSNGNTVVAMAANTVAIVTANIATPTTSAHWELIYQFNSLATAAVNPTVQKFVNTNSASAGATATAVTGNYTTPSGVQFIRVRGVGAGGGAAGSCSAPSASGGSGGAGGNTTFGTSLLVANGGNGGVNNTGSGNGGTGGTASLGTAIGTAITGGGGQGSAVSTNSSLTAYMQGGMGGSSAFGAGAGGGGGSSGGVSAPATGGGGGGGAGAPLGGMSGAGGGGGAFFDAIVVPTAGQVFAYQVGGQGGGGTAGTGGTVGFVGGAGGGGYLEITEYYTNLAVGTQAAISANQFMAGPTSGSAAQPIFRTLAQADLPAAINAYYNGTPTGSTTAATYNIVTFPTLQNDSNSAYSSGAYTIPTTATYDISAYIDVSNVHQYLGIAIYKNGVSLDNVVNILGGTDQEATVLISIHGITLVASDLITIRVNPRANTGTVTYNQGFFSIAKTGH